MSDYENAIDKKRLLLLILSAAAAVAIVAAFGWLAARMGLIGASVGVFGLSDSNNFHPLVRHEVEEEFHCYDDGSLYCENVSKNWKRSVSKELTLGYLGHDFKTAGSENKKTWVYSCSAPKNNRYYFALGAKEMNEVCRGKYGHIYRMGVVFNKATDDISTALYRCVREDGEDVILTTEPDECAFNESYESRVQLMGYIAGSGYELQQEVRGMCEDLKEQCAAGGAGSGLCGVFEQECGFLSK